jgi:phosphoribosylglycinamide formyltransferase-1
LEAQKQALDHGVKVTGCTVHLVDSEVDHGPIILQTAVAIRDEDTVETLSSRILREEHRILPEAIRLLTENELRFEERKVLFKN